MVAIMALPVSNQMGCLIAHSYQRRRERHNQDLVGRPINVSKGADQGFLRCGLQISAR
jgi:hypothetical protein